MVCQLKVSRQTVVADTRTESDPAEDTRMPERCHLLIRRDEWQSRGPSRRCDEGSLRGEMHNHEGKLLSVGDERAGDTRWATSRLGGVEG